MKLLPSVEACFMRISEDISELQLSQVLFYFTSFFSVKPDRCHEVSFFAVKYENRLLGLRGILLCASLKILCEFRPAFLKKNNLCFLCFKLVRRKLVIFRLVNDFHVVSQILF